MKGVWVCRGIWKGCGSRQSSTWQPPIPKRAPSFRRPRPLPQICRSGPVPFSQFLCCCYTLNTRLHNCIHSIDKTRNASLPLFCCVRPHIVGFFCDENNELSKVGLLHFVVLFLSLFCMESAELSMSTPQSQPHGNVCTL